MLDYVLKTSLGQSKRSRYTADMTYREFDLDDRTIDAVARNLEIIGEAARHITDEEISGIDGIPWAEVKGMRNFLIHQYADVSRSTIWQTIKNDLPPLEAALRAWLRR